MGLFDNFFRRRVGEAPVDPELEKVRTNVLHLEQDLGIEKKFPSTKKIVEDGKKIGSDKKEEKKDGK